MAAKNKRDARQPLWLRASLFLQLAVVFYGPVVGHCQQVGDLVKNGSYAIQAANGQIILASHLDRPLIPASTLKIATSLMALKILGPNFHFTTSFYLTPGPDLWIKGGGDPMLVSEQISKIATSLRRHGLIQLRHIYLDDSLFTLEQQSVSPTTTNNPYDAGLNALGVNFTTIAITVGPTGEVTSAEEQTPLLPIMTDLGHHLDPGKYRINVGRNRQQILRLSGELFQAILASHGILTTGQISQGHIPPEALLFYEHHSPSLVNIIESMLLYSNNYSANLIFLTCGLQELGKPATWSKARQTMATFLHQNNLAIDDPTIIDGAGLSPHNQVTAQFMLQLLRAFRPHRLLLPRHQDWLLKSGTMTGVYAYAGYLGHQQDAPAIVILLNQQINNRDAILDLLAQAQMNAPGLRLNPIASPPTSPQ